MIAIKQLTPREIERKHARKETLLSFIRDNHRPALENIEAGLFMTAAATLKQAAAYCEELSRIEQELTQHQLALDSLQFRQTYLFAGVAPSP